MFPDVRDESAVIQNTEHDVGNRTEMEVCSIRYVDNFAQAEVDLQLISVFYPVGVADKYGQADVDRVTEKDAGEGLGKHSTHTSHLDDDRSMLAARTEAEIVATDHEIAFLDSLREGGIGILEDMFRQFGQVAPQIEISTWDDQVSRDIIAEFEGFTF